MIRQQIEEFAVDDLSWRGLFPQVRLKREAGPQQIKSGDYVLEITIEGASYQARLYEAASRQQTMQDGPPFPGYALFHPECADHRIELFTVEDEIAWIGEKGLGGLAPRLLHTYDKMVQTAKFYEHGEREYLPFMRECCYCR